MRFPAKKNAGCPKAPCDFPPRKDGILCPRRVVLGLPSPSHRVCGRTDGRTDVRMYGRTDVWTDGHVTITSQPKFLGLIGYHAYFLSNGAPLEGFARRLRYQHKIFFSTQLFYFSSASMLDTRHGTKYVIMIMP